MGEAFPRSSGEQTIATDESEGKKQVKRLRYPSGLYPDYSRWDSAGESSRRPAQAVEASSASTSTGSDSIGNVPNSGMGGISEEMLEDPDNWDMPGEPEPLEIDLSKEGSARDGQNTSEGDASTETQPSNRAQSDPVAQPEAESESENKAKSENESESEVESESENEAESEAESESESEAESEEESEFGEEREMSRAERRLRDYRERYDDISDRIQDLRDENDSLNFEIGSIDRELKENAKERDVIVKKIGERRKIIDDTKSGIISGFTRGLKIAKELALGKHDEVERILDDLKRKNEDNRKATADLEMLNIELENNNQRRLRLTEERREKVNRYNVNSRRIEKRKKKQKEVGANVFLLEDEVESEKRAEEWKDWKEDRKKARSEIRGIERFKVKKLRNWEQMDEELDRMEKVFKRDRERQIAEIERREKDKFMISLVERLGGTIKDWEDLIKQEKERVEDKYDERMDILRQKRGEIYAAFPLREERAKAKREMLGEDATVRGALDGLKRKVLLRIRGII